MQALLLRALVARFWAQPYRQPLVRWGTRAARPLHAAALRLAGPARRAGRTARRPVIPFERDWLAPFVEFRFPRYGRVQVGDIELELRAAIEPWHVLGEEATGGGTARYVDSSVERLQVRAHRR